MTGRLAIPGGWSQVWPEASGQEQDEKAVPEDKIGWSCGCTGIEVQKSGGRAGDEG